MIFKKKKRNTLSFYTYKLHFIIINKHKTYLYHNYIQ